MRTVDARDANSASLNTTPKIGQAEKDKTKSTSPHASPYAKTKARRPSQEQRACSDPTPTPMLYPQLQPGYPTYYTGAQYAPVVVHMPPLVMHVPFAPQLQPQLQLQFAPTPTPTPTTRDFRLGPKRGSILLRPHCSHPDLWGLVGTLFGSIFD